LRAGARGFKLFSLVFVLFAVVFGPLTIDNGETEQQVTIGAAAASSREVLSLGEVKNLYAQALADYYQGDFLKAEKAFTDLRGQVPEELRDDLDFWVAECSFRLGRQGEAETGFYGYLKRRPQGPRTDLAWQRLNLLTNQGG